MKHIQTAGAHSEIRMNSPEPEVMRLSCCDYQSDVFNGIECYCECDTLLINWFSFNSEVAVSQGNIALKVRKDDCLDFKLYHNTNRFAHSMSTVKI
jgi:hypothetical protein